MNSLALALSPDGKIACVVLDSSNPVQCYNRSDAYVLPNIPVNQNATIKIELSFEGNRHFMCVTQTIPQNFTYHCVYFSSTGTVTAGVSRSMSMVAADTAVIGGILTSVVSTSTPRTVVASYSIDGSGEFSQGDDRLLSKIVAKAFVKNQMVRFTYQFLASAGCNLCSFSFLLTYLCLCCT